MRFIAITIGKKAISSGKGDDVNYNGSELSEEDGKVEWKCEGLFKIVQTAMLWTMKWNKKDAK